MLSMKKKIVICIIAFLSSVLPVYPQSAFTFYDQQVAPGSKQHFLIPLNSGSDSTAIPVTVFHGRAAGPVLGITAGVHGYEYAPIMAAQELIKTINPQQLRGTVILVQIANPDGFLGRSPYVNPKDRKNLNRSFPGNASGTITDRIAHFISSEVIAKCDYFLDMHSGDAPEDLKHYVAYYHNDRKPEISAAGEAMAKATGFDHIVVFQTTEKDYMKPTNPSLYCSAEAFKRGIPSMDFECGKLGLLSEDLVDKIELGVANLLIHLDMLPGKLTETEAYVVIRQRSYLESEFDGIFYPLKESGEYVSKGMLLGYVNDFFGKKLQNIYANADGILLLILGTPPVNEGESVAVIGVVND